jgi:hypothetical protein
MANLFINFTDEISEHIWNACYAHFVFIGILPEEGDSLAYKTLF